MSAERPPVPREGFIPVDGAELYYREVGQGRPIIILHGGPDFDHNYFLPAMDRFADAYRLIYYAQRGRGKSSGSVRPRDVSLESEMADLDRVREHFGLESAAVLGHSWGGVLAMEYAIHHPARVSQLILLNTGPASHEDYLRFRQERNRRTPEVMVKLKTLSAAPGYANGDREAEAAYYRVHFGPTIRQPENLARLVQSLRVNFSAPDILKARAIEERLMQQTWLSDDYNLFPSLARLHIPTLVIHGDDDLIPIICAVHIVQAIPGTRFVLLRDCGHFSYLEQSDKVQQAITDLLNS
jgi:proline iminopeptidase